MISIHLEYIMTLCAIFIRTLSILFPLPLFGDESVPLHIKISLAIALSFGFAPFISSLWLNQVPMSTLPIVTMVVQEVILGALIGFLSRFIFDAVMMGANLVGYQMGFGTANLMLPGTTEQINSFTALHRILAILIFLSLNLHLVMIEGILDSFYHIPPGKAVLHGELGQVVIRTSATIFSSALQLSSPVLISLLFTMAALGLLAKTVPQLNVFTLSFPLSFMIGLFVWIASLNIFPNWLEIHFNSVLHDMFHTIRSVGSLNHGR